MWNVLFLWQRAEWVTQKSPKNVGGGANQYVTRQTKQKNQITIVCTKQTIEYIYILSHTSKVYRRIYPNEVNRHIQEQIHPPVEIIMRRQIIITTKTFHHNNNLVVLLLPVVVVVVMVAMWQEVIPSARRDDNTFVHGFHLNTGSNTQRQRRHDLRTTSFTRLRRSAPHPHNNHHHHPHDNYDLDPNNESSSSSSSIFPTHHRRTILRRMVGLTTLSTLVVPTFLLLPSALSPPPANAFVNKISKQYDDRPKRRGPKVRSISI